MKKSMLIVLLWAVCVLPAASSVYQPISISPIANAQLTTFYVDPPTGDVCFGGVPFHIDSVGYNVFETDESGYGSGKPVTGELSTDIANPLVAHLLITGTSTHDIYLGQTMGNITFQYADGDTQIYNLIVGDTIRDWVTWPRAVSSTTNPNIQTVWSGSSQEGWYNNEAIINMLSIPLRRGKRLTGITVNDTSYSSVYNTDPGLFFYGVTIESAAVPEPSSLFILMCGVGGVGGMVWSRRK